MRWKVPPIERASARASVVFPTPGTSSISRWPRAQSAITAWRITPGLPRSTRPMFASSADNSSAGARDPPTFAVEPRQSCCGHGEGAIISPHPVLTRWRGIQKHIQSGGPISLLFAQKHRFGDFMGYIRARLASFSLSLPLLAVVGFTVGCGDNAPGQTGTGGSVATAPAASGGGSAGTGGGTGRQARRRWNGRCRRRWAVRRVASVAAAAERAAWAAAPAARGARAAWAVAPAAWDRRRRRQGRRGWAV